MKKSVLLCGALTIINLGIFLGIVTYQGAAIADGSKVAVAEAVLAKSVVLVNDNRKPGIALGTSNDGKTKLSLFDLKGRERIQIGVGGNGEPYIAFKDERAKTRMIMGWFVMKNRSKGLSMRPENPVFMTLNEKGQMIWRSATVKKK